MIQTALGLIQDPNGWETLGKLMSNPELISQFTAGSGMEQLFGSALGQAKKESSKCEYYIKRERSFLLQHKRRTRNFYRKTAILE